MKPYFLNILANKDCDKFLVEITGEKTVYEREVEMRRNNDEIKNMKYVYYEKTENVLQAINLRKNLKKWSNFWIRCLIECCNPDWKDLKDEMFEVSIVTRLKCINRESSGCKKYYKGFLI